MLVRAESECTVVRQGRRELHHLVFAVSKVHHGRVRRGEVRPSYSKTCRAFSAPDSESHQARRIGVRPVPRKWHDAAAELTERVCYGLELDPKYVEIGRASCR